MLFSSPFYPNLASPSELQCSAVNAHLPDSRPARPGPVRAEGPAAGMGENRSNTPSRCSRQIYHVTGAGWQFLTMQLFCLDCWLSYCVHTALPRCNEYEVQ